MAAAPMRGHGEWSHLEMLTAAVVDLLAEIAWLNSDGKTDRPKPIPRPGVAKVVGINEAGRAYLERLRAGHGARQLTGG